MNQKNSLGLNECFLDMDNPFDLFKIWMEKAKKSEVNHPNATSLATSDKDNNPSVRISSSSGSPPRKGNADISQKYT